MSDKDEKEARRWKRELRASKKRDEKWLDEAKKVVVRYRGEERRKSRWNVLWTNTRILRPVIYNSRPNPDVRRRFRDADPLGKAISELLERALSVFVDHDETDASIKNDVLDSLLVGRGVSRIRYEPRIGATPKKVANDDSGDGEADGSAPEEDEDDAVDEHLEGEQVICEHVDWRDYREGYGRVHAEVPWKAYRHKLTKADAEEKFDKEQLKDVEYSTPEEDEATKDKAEEEIGDPAKVAEFWEVWDKIGHSCFFVHDDVKQLLYPKDNPDGTPPFEIDGFFPSPDPLNVMADTGSRIPIPMFRMYEEQADELDRISGRIDRIVGALRLRGVYDASLPELAQLFSSDDNDMVPIQNAGRWDKTGLDGAMSWMPTEKAVEILQTLVEAREQQLKAIDQILGISDIVRGATDPDETATAQTMKGGYFSARLFDMKDTVQRYVRDLLRIASSMMAQKFEQQTFADMTDMNFPTAADQARVKQQLAQQASMAMMSQARMYTPPPPQVGPGPGTPGGPVQMSAPHPPIPGAPPAPGAGPVPPHPAPGAPQAPPGPPVGPPPAQGVPHPPMPPAPPPGPNPQQQAMLAMPTWEQIISAMRDDRLRQYKVDVETDSMVQGTMVSDMAGLAEVLGAVTKALTEMAPLITAGALPVDAAKEIVMTIIRRARMGLAVEDAFDKMQAPKPPPDPNAGKAQAAIAAVQAKGQVDAQNAQVKAQTDIQVATIKAQLDKQVADAQQQAQAMQNRQEQFLEQQRDREQAQADAWQTKLDAAVKIIVAQIAAKTAVDTATISAANQEATSDL